MEITAQHELFMEHYLDCGDVGEAAELAGFDRSYGRKLFHKLKDRIVPMMEEEVVMMQVKAVAVLKDSMGAGAEKHKQEIRLRAADSVLDRGGITKKQSLDVSGSELPAVMILPAKNPEPASAEV
jgi:hypothetical protein